MPQSQEETQLLNNWGQYAGCYPPVNLDSLSDGASQLYPQPQPRPSEIQNPPLMYHAAAPEDLHDSNQAPTPWRRIERALAHERSRSEALTSMLQYLLGEVRKDDERYHETLRSQVIEGQKCAERSHEVGTMLRELQKDVAGIRTSRTQQRHQEVFRQSHMAYDTHSSSDAVVPKRVSDEETQVGQSVYESAESETTPTPCDGDKPNLLGNHQLEVLAQPYHTDSDEPIQRGELVGMGENGFAWILLLVCFIGGLLAVLFIYYLFLYLLAT